MGLPPKGRDGPQGNFSKKKLLGFGPQFLGGPYFFNFLFKFYFIFPTFCLVWEGHGPACPPLVCALDPKQQIIIINIKKQQMRCSATTFTKTSSHDLNQNVMSQKNHQSSIKGPYQAYPHNGTWSNFLATNFF